MTLIYLDYNCFQRRFDEPQQTRIQLEALACQEIFNLAEQQILQLAWSFMHDDETLLCPFPERQAVAIELSSLCEIRIPPRESIYQLAQDFLQRGNFSAKDAAHVACAVDIQADYFLTCDDQLRRQATKLGLTMEVGNPVDYIREVTS